MPEISEEEYRSLVANNKFLEQALKNPQAREKLLRARKDVDPTAVIPELDVPAQYVGRIDEVSKSVADLKKAIEEDREARKAEAQQEKLQAQWNTGRNYASSQGYTGEALTDLEKFMEENGVASHRIAIAAYEREHPQPQSVTPNGSVRNFDAFRGKVASEKEQENQKRLVAGDVDGFLEAAIPDILAEMRGQKVA